MPEQQPDADQTQGDEIIAQHWDQLHTAQIAARYAHARLTDIVLDKAVIQDIVKQMTETHDET